jgi:TnpA family transposase
VPVRPLSDAEIERLTTWPPEVAHSDLAAHFTLGVDDLRWVRSFRGAGNRLALAVQLCGLTYLGYVPTVLAATPPEVVARLAERVGVAPSALARYSRESGDRLRREHAALVIERAGWTSCGRGEWKVLGDWLVARALEHDTTSVLFRQALDHLRAERIVRPGLDRLLRAIASARVTADSELHRRLRPQLTPSRCEELDRLVETDPARGVAPLVWLGEGATSASADSIKAELAKLAYLRGLGAERLDLDAIPPERRRQLAALARRSTPRAMRQMAPERRHPALLAAVANMHAAVVDEVVQMFDQALAATDSRARDRIEEREAAIARADVERLVLLDEMLGVVLDESLDDTAVGTRLRGMGRERLTAAAREPDGRLPADRGHLELMEARFAHVRSFAPHVLAALAFSASVSPSEVLDAVRVLQAANADGRRHVPLDAPVGFVPARWQPYLRATREAGDDTQFKHYWELCVLFGLRGALHSGEVWVEGSRRYADPASYLIAPGDWPHQRDEALQLCGQPASFADRLSAIDEELAGYLDLLEPALASGDGAIRLDEKGELNLSPLAAETVDPAVIEEGDRIVARLPTVPLAELLIEVDQLAAFSSHLTHAGGATPRSSELEHRRNLYAAVLAQACNFGTTRMAELTGISVDTLDWYTRWYLREETLRPASAAIVNAHHRHPLAAAWGGGTLSSSDGLRLPMQGRSLTARFLSRYFVDQGITTYTHVSDQHSTYGTQVIVSTERDATYTLDEILGNTTELPIVEHAADTHGQTLATFALFDLVGLRLSPRIAKLTDKRRWRPHEPGRYARWPHAGPLLEHHAQTELIAEHWDDLLRVGASLKMGHVSASLLVTRLQAGSRQHPLAKALVEHGKLLRTLHALRWFTDEAFRRRIGRQLNRGEALNDLRRFLSFGHRGHVRHRHHDDQTMQAHCLTLVTNACVLSTTHYLQEAIDAHRADGYEVTDEVVAHLSPARFEAINPYGAYTIDVAAILNRTSPRPLRRPTSRGGTT